MMIDQNSRRNQQVYGRQGRKKRRRPKKLSWVLLLTIVPMICFIISFAMPANASEILEVRPMSEVIVSDGDTLWTLVKEYRPNYKGDIRRAIYEIQKINDLKGAKLYPGQILKIPIQ